MAWGREDAAGVGKTPRHACSLSLSTADTGGRARYQARRVAQRTHSLPPTQVKGPAGLVLDSTEMTGSPVVTLQLEAMT